MECSSLAPSMRSFCLTRFDSASATSKRRPDAATAPAPAAPTLRNSRRVTVGNSSPPNVLNLRLPGGYVKFSACGHEQVAAVVGLGVAQQVDQSRIPRHHDARRARGLVVVKHRGPRFSVDGHGPLGPGLALGL